MTALRDRLAALIAASGPMSVADYMAACLFDPRHGYYSTRPGLGTDFVTAPEISQMFGELLGLWSADAWAALNRPAAVQWIELGPGRGTLMADAWRASRVAPSFRAAAAVTLVDASAPLRAQQARALDAVNLAPQWASTLSEVAPGASLIIANEFLDCFPIRQFLALEDGWRERLVGLNSSGDLVFGLSPAPASLGVTAPAGTIVELAAALPAFVDEIAARLMAHPGRALFIDYGGDGVGDTLQAVRAGEKVSPLDAPGASDLTAHVDFHRLRRLAEAAGLAVHGPTPQSVFLRALGLEARTATLCAARPDKAETIRAGAARLTDEAGMGTLFKAMCLSSPGLPLPAGFFPGSPS